MFEERRLAGESAVFVREGVAMTTTTTTTTTTNTTTTTTSTSNNNHNNINWTTRAITISGQVGGPRPRRRRYDLLYYGVLLH